MDEALQVVIEMTESIGQGFGKDLEGVTPEEADWRNWTLRSGDQILMDLTKYETIRHTYCQIVHHRAQMGVFLRLLDVPIPGSYGPSADE